MNDLQNAEITIETRFSIESGANNGNTFSMSEYNNMEELMIDCAGWFDMESEPEYIYKEWNGIPDCLINESWFSPNFFELRDALQAIGDSSTYIFWKWCETFGWNPGADEPSQLVTEFIYSMNMLPTLPEEEPDYCDEDESNMFVFDCTGSSTEVFNDDYN